MTAARTLLITGGSRGIGLATAERFAEDGYHVVNLSRSPSSIVGSVHIAADFTDLSWAVHAAGPLRDAVAGSGMICLVHNSAFQAPDSVADIDIDSLRRSLEINVVAPAILNQLLLPLMGRGSSILYVGSTLSHRATSGMATYVTSKHAVAGLMKSTAQDLAGTGIHTACLCPGFTNTEMLQRYGGAALDHLASLVTQKRLIEPREIAEMLFQAACNPVINGSMIQADLGFIEP